MRPGLVRWEVWHCVLSESAVHLIALVVEGRAEPAPAGMPFSPAGHTPLSRLAIDMPGKPCFRLSNLQPPLQDVENSFLYFL